VYLEMIHIMLKIEGVRRFYRDFILDDMKVTVQDNSSVLSMFESIG
jgi:hypothetical protein